MPRQETGVLAIFKYLDTTCEVAKRIMAEDGFQNHRLYSHTSYHELMHVAEERFGGSPVRWFTLLGSLFGCAVGYLMPVLMDYDWPLVVGGKTAGIHSSIPNVIFMFELFVLFGALATIVSMLWFGRLANPRAHILDVRLTDDRFAVFVPGAREGGPQATLLKELGAEEVHEISGDRHRHAAM